MSIRQHMSLSNERYTPSPFVEAARQLMGDIDVDPASHYIANRVVKADRFYGQIDQDFFCNGFVRKWTGTVFLNPPGGICDMYGRQVHRATSKRKSCVETGSCGLDPGHIHTGSGSSAKLWWARLADQWKRGIVTEAIFIGFTLEILRSTQSLPEHIVKPAKMPFCIPDSRMKFWEPQSDGTLKELKQPTHANVIVYLPPRDNTPNGWRKSVGKLRLFEDAFKQFGVVRL